MRAYSSDLRERIVRAVDQGRSQREAARLFSVGVSSVKRYLQRRAQTGSLAQRPIPGGVRRIGPEQEAALDAQVAAAPEATMAEHCARWEAEQGQRVSRSTLGRAIRRLGWTRKQGRWVRVSATKPPAPTGSSS